MIQGSLPLPDTAEGGYIIRDSSGVPSGEYYITSTATNIPILLAGVFIDNAQDLVKRPALTDVDLGRRFAVTVDAALSRGLTSIHDAGFDPVSLEFFKR